MIPGSALIHQRRLFDSYFSLPSNMIKYNSNSQGLLVYGSDWEHNLSDAFDSCFPKSKYLLCDIHMLWLPRPSQTKQLASRMSKESYNCFKDEGERMETWRRGHSQMYIFIYPKTAWRSRILILSHRKSTALLI